MAPLIDQKLNQFKKNQTLMILLVLTIIAIGFLQPSQHAYLKKNHINFIPKYFKQWRQNFIIEQDQSVYGSLIRGIFLGDASSLSRTTNDLFRQAGLSHLTAASGFNCFMVAYCFSLGGSLLLNILGPGLALYQQLFAKRWLPIAAKMLGAWLFWLWSDQSPPITRSVVMISCYFAFELSRWRISFKHFLVVQYCLFIICYPEIFQNISFQLTFGCLLGMVYGQVPLQNWLGQRFGLPRWLAAYIAATTSACLGTAPTTWLYFGQINFTGLFTNWFSGPLVSFFIMPISLLEMFWCLPGLKSLAPTEGWTIIFKILNTVNIFFTQCLLYFIQQSLDYLPKLIIYQSYQ